MGMEQGIVVLIFVATLSALLATQIQPVKIFGAALFACLLSQLVSSDELLGNAVNRGVTTLILLLLVSVAVEKTSWLRRLSTKLIFESYTKTLLSLTTATAISSGFLNNTAVVAALIPSVKNNGIHIPSKLLIPLSYAAILGGTLTLIGTSTNLIVDSLWLESGGDGFEFFDFFLIGAPVTAIGVSVIMLTSRFLPGLKGRNGDVRGYFIDAKVDVKSDLIGKSVLDNGLRNLESLFLVEIVRGDRLISPVTPSEVIEENDRLVFSGNVNRLYLLKQFHGLSLFADSSGMLSSNLSEVVVMPNAAIVNRTLKDVGFRSRFDAAVVAMRRDGERLSGKLGDVEIRPGDNLVIATGLDFAARHNLRKNFVFVSGISLPTTLTRMQEKLVGCGFLAAVAGAATGVIPLLDSLLVLLAVFVACKVLTLNEIKRRFPLELWLIVVSALSMAVAFKNSGLADTLANQLQVVAAGQGIWIAFVVIYLATLVLTEVVTNNAAAALIFPVAYSLSGAFGVNPMPFVMAVAFGASASFISPYGYQTNLMVFNTGRYHFKDFSRVGIPLSLIYSFTVLTLIPLVFPF